MRTVWINLTLQSIHISTNLFSRLSVTAKVSTSVRNILQNWDFFWFSHLYTFYVCTFSNSAIKHFVYFINFLGAFARFSANICYFNLQEPIPLLCRRFSNTSGFYLHAIASPCAQFRAINARELRSTSLRFFFIFWEFLIWTLWQAIMAIDYCAISFNFPEFLQFIHKSAELHILVLSAEKIEYFLYLSI